MPFIGVSELALSFILNFIIPTERTCFGVKYSFSICYFSSKNNFKIFD
jgi:hypothetical protein